MNDAAELRLRPVEARILGCLVEKEVTTPDYYPLSLNSLLNACNQKSSREPVMSLSEDDLRPALHRLQDLGLVASVSGADSRVSKYEHRLQERFNFGRRETAVLCLLFLRGPQTVGELRGRSERLYRFEELSDVQSALQKLMDWDPPLVKLLPRLPGTKESRYAHLLSGEQESWGALPEIAAAPSSAGRQTGDRADEMEARVTALEVQISELKQQLEELRSALS